MPANRRWKVDDNSLQPGPDEASSLEVLEERGRDQAHRWAHKADGDGAPDQDDQQDWRFRRNQPLSQVNDRLFKKAAYNCTRLTISSIMLTCIYISFCFRVITKTASK